jgi:diacylglycerol O-acyltransferase
VSIDDIMSVKQAFGGTLNDAVLAGISGGFRSLLVSRGEQPAAHMVPSLVPVSVRAPGEEGIYENRVSAMVAYLPVHVADPVERLRAVQAQLADLKASKEAYAGETMIALARAVPFPVASFAVRLAFRLAQRDIVTVTTNVPGPRQPLYGLGRRLVEIIPYGPIATTVRTGITIFTYCATVTFGITADYDATPDVDVLARGVEEGVSALVKAARGARRRRGTRHA